MAVPEQNQTDPSPIDDDHRVRQCLCFEQSFDELLDLHDRLGGGLLELNSETGCGARCGLCVPYMLLMLRTRATVFDPMWTQDFRDRGVPPGNIRTLEQSLIARGELPPHGGGERPLEPVAVSPTPRADHRTG